MSRDGESKLAQLIGNLNERPMRIVEVPGTDGSERVGLWVATVHESQHARKRALEHVQKGIKFTALDLEYDELQALTEAKATETLAVALRDPDAPINPWAADGDEVRKRLSAPVIEGLWSEYVKFVAERSPLKDVEDPEGYVDELVALVAENFPIVTRLSQLARPALTSLLLTALDRCASGTKPSSSAGSSPDASADPSSAP